MTCLIHCPYQKLDINYFALPYSQILNASLHALLKKRWFTENYPQCGKMNKLGSFRALTEKTSGPCLSSCFLLRRGLFRAWPCRQFGGWGESKRKRAGNAFFFPYPPPHPPFGASAKERDVVLARLAPNFFLHFYACSSDSKLTL